MQKEHPIWKIMTLFFAALTIAASLWMHFDTKRSTERKIVETLSDRYEFVDKEMSYEQALEALDKDIKELEKQNKSLQEKVDGYSNTENITNIIDQATGYWNNNNYSQALELLRDSENL